MEKVKSNKAHKTEDLNRHVMILVAGTSDPGNIDDDGTKALSYGTAPTGYWDEKFVKELNEFDKINKNFAVMSLHGWTGDNKIRNRNIAGEYLVNRLCGEGGQEAFYRIKDKPIHFHLLGHSHGGNVMHEMTKRMHDLGDKWPEKWKIKSMIYLSTPFFNDIHQVKVTEKTFHKDAKVFHAFNKYDLTQRVIADFSLEALAGGVSELDTSVLKKSKEKLSTLVDAFPIETLTNREDWTTGLYMTHEAGLDVYTRTIALFQPLKEIVSEIVKIIKVLNTEYTYTINTKIINEKKEEITAKRKLIEDEEHTKIENIFNTLLTDINVIQGRLELTISNTNVNDDFSKKEYIANLLSDNFANNLSTLLDINPSNLSSNDNSIWNILSTVLKGNIEKYDNTYVNPKEQYKNTALKDKIESFEVTSLDKYDGSNGSKNYYNFIDALESIEKTFSNPPSTNNILELLFLLITNEDSLNESISNIPNHISTISDIEWLATGVSDTSLKTLRATLSNLNTIFAPINFGGIADERHILSKEDIVKNNDKDENNDVLKRGSLMYLMKESHSTSRRGLLPQVRDFLTKIGIKV